MQACGSRRTEKRLSERNQKPPPEQSPAQVANKFLDRAKRADQATKRPVEYQCQEQKCEKQDHRPGEYFLQRGTDCHKRQQGFETTERAKAMDGRKQLITHRMSIELIAQKG